MVVQSPSEAAAQVVQLKSAWPLVAAPLTSWSLGGCGAQTRVRIQVEIVLLLSTMPPASQPWRPHHRSQVRWGDTVDGKDAADDWIEVLVQEAGRDSRDSRGRD